MRSAACCYAAPMRSIRWSTWLMVLDVEFEVLEPPALRERLALAAQRITRSLARG
jgi:hypothetical protein